MKSCGIQRLRLWIPLALAGVTVLVFSPVLSNGFVNWDDHANFVHNTAYRGLSLAHLQWMFTTTHLGHYQPLSWLTLGLDYTVWGMYPGGYHLTSLLLHTANAVLFYLLTLMILQRAFSRHATPAFPVLHLSAAAAGLLFAVHPLRVESVAWVTERRDVLSGFFFLSTLMAYLRAQSPGTRPGTARRTWLRISLLCFLCSLLSKAWGITLPLVLLLIDTCPLGRFGKEGARKILLEKIPFLLLALTAAGVAVLAQTLAAAARPLTDHALVDRVMQAAYGLCFYPMKTLLPVNLSPLYEMEIPFEPFASRNVWSLVVAVAVTGVLFLSRRRWPHPWTAWALYAVIVSPVLGFLQSGSQVVADRYTYLACLPLAVLVGGGLARWCSKTEWVRHARIAATGAVGLLGVFAGFTMQRAHGWRDSVVLWQGALAACPGSHIAHYNLGQALEEQGRIEAAIRHYRSALAANPRNTGINLHLGRAYFKKNRLDPAISCWRTLAQEEPENASVHFHLGLAHFRLGRLEEAVRGYRRSLSIDPAHADAWNNLGTALGAQGKLESAVHAWKRAVATAPTHIHARSNLGAGLFNMGKREEAARQFRLALALKPGDPVLLKKLEAVSCPAVSTRFQHENVFQ